MSKVDCSKCQISRYVTGYTTDLEYIKLYKLSEHGKEIQAKYYHSEAKRESNHRWNAKNMNPIRRVAYSLVVSAIRKGVLKRLPCEVCNKPNGFAHHDDYNKPLEVKWFCNFHHSEYHRKIKDLEVAEAKENTM
jgi:hypothetical protein